MVKLKYPTTNPPKAKTFSLDAVLHIRKEIQTEYDDAPTGGKRQAYGHVLELIDDMLAELDEEIGGS